MARPLVKAVIDTRARDPRQSLDLSRLSAGALGLIVLSHSDERRCRTDAGQKAQCLQLPLTASCSNQRRRTPVTGIHQRLHRVTRRSGRSFCRHIDPKQTLGLDPTSPQDVDGDDHCPGIAFVDAATTAIVSALRGRGGSGPCGFPARS
jgi:hypothetical protein